MKSLKASEANFINNETIDLAKDKRLMLTVNLLAIISFALFYWMFFYLTKLFSINPSNDLLFYFKGIKGQSQIFTLSYIVIILLVFVLHELIHGLFFYLFTGEKPVFGYKLVYAYAGAPDWYIKKNYFYVISLSPLLLITIIGFIVLAIAPVNFSSIIFLSFTANAAGSAGDIWISCRLLRKPEETYIRDSGTVSVISHNGDI